MNYEMREFLWEGMGILHTNLTRNANEQCWEWEVLATWE